MTFDELLELFETEPRPRDLYPHPIETASKKVEHNWPSTGHLEGRRPWPPFQGHRKRLGGDGT